METIASGGVEQRRLFLAQWLNNQRFEIKIICTEAVGFLAAELRNLGVEIIEIGIFNHLFHVKKYLKIIDVTKQFKPHIIHGAVYEGIIMAVIGGVFGEVPIRLIEETSDPQNRSNKANFLLRQLVKLSDRIIAISPNVENYLIKKAKIPIQKIILITNGVKIPRQVEFDEVQNINNKLDLRIEDLIVGFVGRLFDDHKKVSDLINAIALIDDSSVKLLIVGDGRDRKEIESLIHNLAIKERVFMVGHQSDPSPFYKVMDIFCAPSSREGFGLVAAEAMLHKLPVITTKVGGLQDIVVDCETGFLVPPNTPIQIAKKLEILIKNPELRKSMGQKGYERAIENYTAERYCQEVENLYLELLKEIGLFT